MLCGGAYFVHRRLAGAQQTTGAGLGDQIHGEILVKIAGQPDDGHSGRQSLIAGSAAPVTDHQRGSLRRQLAGQVSGSSRACAQRGFALVSAIFLITSLFLLSAFMVGLRVYQDSGISLDTLGTRAYAAARSGAEWGVYNVVHSSACAASTALSLGGSLSSYAATVTCSAASPAFNEGGSMINMYTIVSTACNQPSGGNCPNATPGANYVERQISMSVAQ